MRIFGWFGVADFRENRVLWRQLSGQPRPAWWSCWVYWKCGVIDWCLLHLRVFRTRLERTPHLWLNRPATLSHPAYIVRWNGWRGAQGDEEIKGYWWAWPRRDHDDAVGYVARGADGRVGPYRKGQRFDEALPPIQPELRLFLGSLPPLTELERRQAVAYRRLLGCLGG